MALNIQMVDLQTLHLRLENEIDTAVKQVIQSSGFINGKEVTEFADNLKKYLQTQHVIPVANGTDALQIALMSLDIKQGDEVITPDFTFVATAEAVAIIGATPILIDVNSDDFNINVDLLESHITPKTKAIIPVHLFGQCANMSEINQLAKKHNLFVIEDTAQALGTQYKGKMAGTLGDIGCTSFFPSKNLGCFGDGGALFTANNDLAEKIRMIANHGSKVKYYNEIIGMNSRLDTIQATVLNVKLKYLDTLNIRRKKSAEFYSKNLEDIQEIETPKQNGNSTHIYHQYTLKVPEGENIKLQQWLKEHKIPSMIYYPVPIHNQKAFSCYKIDKQNFPTSTMLSKRVISLPMHTELTREQQHYIIDKIHTYFKIR